MVPDVIARVKAFILRQRLAEHSKKPRESFAQQYRAWHLLELAIIYGFIAPLVMMACLLWAVSLVITTRLKGPGHDSDCDCPSTNLIRCDLHDLLNHPPAPVCVVVLCRQLSHGVRVRGWIICCDSGDIWPAANEAFTRSECVGVLEGLIHRHIGR